VGRSLVVAEWAGARPRTRFTTLTEAERRPDLLQVIDADQVRSWTPLLRPLEEAAFPVVVIAQRLPTPVLSRLPVFRAGYLTQSEVSEVLAEKFPTLRPRPALAELAQGSLDEIAKLEKVAETFETLNTSLAAGRLELRKSDPVALLAGLKALCRTVAGLDTLPFSPAARATIPRAAATALLARPDPSGEHEARNLLALFWAAVHG
jgi:hypothetical protein